MPKLEKMRSSDGLETRNLVASSGTTTCLLFTRKRLMNLEIGDMYEHSIGGPECLGVPTSNCTDIRPDPRTVSLQLVSFSGQVFIWNLVMTIGDIMCCSFIMTSVNPGFLSIGVPTTQDPGVTDFPEASGVPWIECWCLETDNGL